MHVVREVLASRCLTANWLRLPVVAQARPNPSLLLVGRPVLTVGNISAWQIQFEHEISSFETAGLWILEGPVYRGKVLYDLQRLLYERVGIGQFLLGAFFVLRAIE